QAERALVGHARADIHGPRHPAGVATGRMLEHAVCGAPGIAFLGIGRTGAVLNAQAVAVVALPVVRVADNERGDRAAGLGIDRGALAPGVGRRAGAAEVDLVAVVVGERAVAVEDDGRVVEVLGATGIAEVGIGVDRPLGGAPVPRQRG